MAGPTGTDGDDLWSRHSLYLLTWADFDAAIRSLTARVRSTAPEVDCVLGVSRGGLVPAVALSNALGVSTFHAIAVGRNVGDGQYLDKQPPTVLWGDDLTGLRGRRVLVVDDVAGSGATLRHVREQVALAGAAEVWTTVLVRMKRGAGEVDFVAVELDDWVVFPWEGTEPPPGARTRAVTVPEQEVGR
ncbi:phosphoribosyltransferase family protein [Actinosynnema sp. NPDC050436]|uniref:phosphoribosyltransferase n=1 Tax=Actinosynnema sp. NPDC050436 TaxID=3155659 RepID=UPI0033EDD4ED